jgi:hypothetical protein
MPGNEATEFGVESTRRRRFLQAVGALGAVGLAGCGGDGDGTETDDGGDGTATDTETDDDGSDETPTDTQTDDDGGDETPTDTETDDGGDETPTETETPNQDFPSDPATVVTFSGGGSVSPGETTTLTATAENPYLFPIQSVQLSLEGPNADWTVEATGDTNLGTIETGANKEVSWDITAPEGADGGFTLSGSISYESTTDQVQQEFSQSITVFDPGDVPQGGLEAYYSLDGDTATNLVTGTDATSGTTEYPTTGAPGVVGNAFEFTTSGDTSNSSDALVSGEDLPLNGEGATLGAWFRYSSKEAFARIYQVGGNVSTPGVQDAYEIIFFEDTDEILVVTNGGGRSQATLTLSPDTWFFVVTVFDGDDIRLHAFDQEGEIDASPATATNGRTQGGPFPLVLMNGDDSESAGRMDEVRAYSRALSEAEVTALYEGSSGSS